MDTTYEIPCSWIRCDTSDRIHAKSFLYARCVLRSTLDINILDYHALIRQMGNSRSGYVFVQISAASFSESLINKGPSRRN